MDSFEEKACLCALGHIFGFEPRTALALIEHFGSASAIFRCGEKEIDSLLGPFSKYRGKICREAVEKAYGELERLYPEGIIFTGWTEEGYPSLLKECPDAPAGIYIKGGPEAMRTWNSRRCIAVVGTRDLSPYGMQWCERLVTSLAGTAEKPVIVSGLAIGTDICAHRSALDAGLPTVAVMATGPEKVYPSRHAGTAGRIASTADGALITDYPPGTAPLPVHFLRRNRIIAGMCDTLVLTESKAKGGGMTSARLSFSYDRSVFTFPGRVDDIRSQGCNILIRSKMAEPVIDIDTFIEDIGLHRGKKDGGHITEEIPLPPSGTVSGNDIDIMSRILVQIRKEAGLTPEELGRRVGCGYSKASRLTAILESDGFITTDLLRRCMINVKKM